MVSLHYPSPHGYVSLSPPHLCPSLHAVITLPAWTSPSPIFLCPLLAASSDLSWELSPTSLAICISPYSLRPLGALCSLFHSCPFSFNPTRLQIPREEVLLSQPHCLARCLVDSKPDNWFTKGISCKSMIL